MSSLKIKLSTLTKQTIYQRVVAILVIALVSMAGYYLTKGGHASGPYASASATGGVLTGMASSQNGSYVQFGNPPNSGFPFATSISANHRYILDQFGKPFMMVGDSPHTLSTYDTPAQMETYFQTRHSQGFNTALVQVIVGIYIDNTNIIPGVGTFENIEGQSPFSTAGDITSENPAYFNTLVTLVQEAEANGITVMFDPAETGTLLQQTAMLQNNGKAKDYAFGQYLGNLFKSYHNVIWQSGNDYSDWGPTNDNYVLNGVAEGIRNVAPNQLQTVEILENVPNSTVQTPNVSSDDPSWGIFDDINGAYTYYSPYSMVLHGYNYSGKVQPVFGEEYNYEDEDNTGDGCNYGNAYDLRHQEYWTMTSGATGQLYGNHYTWDASSWSQELSNLTSPGEQQIGYMANLFNAVAWYNLVPDQSGSFVQGAFTGQNQGEECDDSTVTAGVSADGTLGMAYLPTGGSVTVTMSKMSGTVTARWYDPTTGSYTAIGSFANSGTHQFASPGNHSDGSDDWVLVLQS